MSRKDGRAFGTAAAGAAAGAAAAGLSEATVTDLFAAAVARHQAGAIQEAERQYRHILSLAPNHADSLHNLALIALQNNNAATAVDLIGRAIAINDRAAEYHYNIALAYRALGRLTDVAAHLEHAIALRDNYALAHLNLGNVRHQEGRLGEAAACYERAIALSPNIPIAYFNLANVKAEQAQWEDAIRGYKQALAMQPNLAEAHARLGAALMARGEAKEAITHFEHAVAFNPSLHSGYEALCKAYMATGQLKPAVDAARRALELRETEAGKALFAQAVKFAQFTVDDGGYRKLVLRALTEVWARPRELSSVAISLVTLDPLVKNAIARANAAWPGRVEAAELLGAAGFAALTHDELLCRLLEWDPVVDIGLERLLTNLRRSLLSAALSASGEENADDAALVFYCALARQCFVNEYVFALVDAERDQADHLREKLEAALRSGRPCPAVWLAAVGAYCPLHTIANAEALLERPWPRCVEDLLTQQIRDPAAERRLAAAMPALTVLDSEVSRTVRRQYEENPYPRWVKPGPAPQASGPTERRLKAGDVLIAGCGTGLATIEFAREAPGARILAIDLSLASLSYAKRMARTLGVANVEFAQADIMQLGAIGRTFDFIESSGVLHHLADPWAGWKVLLSLLRPGGSMQVGLYSEAARRNVVAARALIAERGYRPAPEDIRRCRQEIASAPDGSLLKSLTRSSDFFTMSECRDLLFHPQEHRVTLPDIRAFLTANNLAFAGFALDPYALRQFAARFPDPAAALDLDCWQAFEAEAPDTFVGMYLFWVRKPMTAPQEAATVS